MSREEELLLEDFDVWLKTKFTNAFWTKGHKYEKAKGQDVTIDGGFFSREEARELFKMLNSRNPFTRWNAHLLIWERNGVLTMIIVALAITALIVVYFWVRR